MEKIRDILKVVVDSKRFQWFITALIVINGITMGLETSKEFMSGDIGPYLLALDKAIIIIFVIEIILRIYVHRLSFFKDPWSLFDFFVVSISIIPTSGDLAILRVLRVLRLFRLITVIPQMRRIVGALLAVIPGIGSISMILTLFFYVFAIMATNLFGDKFPQWFGTIGESMYSLFQIMTLESWSMGIVRPVMEIYPYAWMFFVPFILIVTFVMVNLFVAIIVDAMSALKEDGEEKLHEELEVSSKHIEQEVSREISELKDEIRGLRELIKESSLAQNSRHP